MKTVRSVINKNLKMILIIAAVTVIALGILLLLISGNEERNQIPTDPTQSEETTEPEETEPDPIDEESGVEPAPGVTKTAQNLYSAKAESIEDSAAVAKLLETIDLKKNVANYIVNLQFKKEPKSLNITFDKTVPAANKDIFDKDMQKYAEQILALITDAGEVQWTYKVKEDGRKAEEVTVYLSEKQASELLKNNVKEYGESEKMVQALLNQQKGQ